MKLFLSLKECNIAMIHSLFLLLPIIIIVYFFFIISQGQIKIMSLPNQLGKGLFLFTLFIIDASHTRGESLSNVMMRSLPETSLLSPGITSHQLKSRLQCDSTRVCVFDIDSTLSHSYFMHDHSKCCSGEGLNGCVGWDSGFGAYGYQGIKRCVDDGAQVVIITAETDFLLRLSGWRDLFHEWHPDVFSTSYVNDRNRFMYNGGGSYSYSLISHKNEGLLKVVERFNTTRDCVLFFDDSEGNGKSAEAIGIRWQIANGRGLGCGMEKYEFDEGFRFIRRRI